MTDPTDREAVRRRARERAERMGLARPETTPDPATHDFLEPLPTTNPQALRALLNSGRLTPGQAAAAQQLFTAVRQYVTDHPEDAA